MRWLITTAVEDDLTDLRRRVADVGGAVVDQIPIPLDSGEQVVSAEGPDDLPDRLRGLSAVRSMHPDSDLELLEPRAGAIRDEIS